MYKGDIQSAPAGYPLPLTETPEPNSFGVFVLDIEEQRERTNRAGAKALETFAKACEAKGIGLKYLAGKLYDELEATEVKVFKTGKDKVIESEPLIAWKTRQQARMDAHKLLGHYPAERKHITHATDDDLDDMTPAELAAELDRLQAEKATAAVTEDGENTGE